MPHPRATTYRLEDLPQDSPAPQVRRRRIMGDKAMISELVIEKGGSAPIHHHDNEQIIMLLSGKLVVTVADAEDGGEREVVLEGGDVMVLPANLPHGAQALEDCRVIDIFSPPSETTGIDQA